MTMTDKGKTRRTITERLTNPIIFVLFAIQGKESAVDCRGKIGQIDSHLEL